MLDGTLDAPLWLPLMDYSLKTGLSLSTLRRQIKSKRIAYRLEKGKYLLLFDGTLPQNLDMQYDPEPTDFSKRIQLLEDEVQKTREELSELKMLVSLLEERVDSK